MVICVEVCDRKDDPVEIVVLVRVIENRQVLRRGFVLVAYFECVKLLFDFRRKDIFLRAERNGKRKNTAPPPLSARVVREPVICQTHIPETAVQTLSVVKQFDISENVGLHLFYCIIFPPVCQLLFKTC